MTNELTRPLTDAEEGLWREKLAALLVRQIALYTANESSSVPAAAAQELLRGVLFFLAVPEEPDGGGEAERADRIRVLLPLDLADELARGQRRAQRDAALTLALWRKVVAALPPLENRSLRDTLRSIGRGFRRYDTVSYTHLKQAQAAENSAAASRSARWAAAAGRSDTVPRS